jgi:hypothetical protein
MTYVENFEVLLMLIVNGLSALLSYFHSTSPFCLIESTFLMVRTGCIFHERDHCHVSDLTENVHIYLLTVCGENIVTNNIC